MSGLRLHPPQNIKNSIMDTANNAANKALPGRALFAAGGIMRYFAEAGAQGDFSLPPDAVPGWHKRMNGTIYILLLEKRLAQ